MRTELQQKPIKDIIDKYQIPELQRLVDNEHINNMVEDQKNEYNKYKTFSMLQSFTIAYIVNEKKVQKAFSRVINTVFIDIQNFSELSR